MTKRDIEKDYYVLKIAVDKKQFTEYFKCYTKIEDLVNNGKPVPAKLFKQWLDYMNDLNTLKIEQDTNIKVGRFGLFKIDHIKEFFTKEPGYDFKEEYIMLEEPVFVPPPGVKVIPDIKSVEPKYGYYSLSGLIKDSLFWYIQIEDSINTKEEAILFFHKKVEDYIKRLNNTHQKQLTPYRRVGIAAYLATIVGWKIIDPSKRMTIDNLYQNSRNAFRPKKHKKKKA